MLTLKINYEKETNIKSSYKTLVIQLVSLRITPQCMKTNCGMCSAFKIDFNYVLHKGGMNLGIRRPSKLSIINKTTFD